MPDEAFGDSWGHIEEFLKMTDKFFMDNMKLEE